jgi:hypothetical protein
MSSTRNPNTMPSLKPFRNGVRCIEVEESAVRHREEGPPLLVDQRRQPEHLDHQLFHGGELVVLERDGVPGDAFDLHTSTPFRGCQGSGTLRRLSRSARADWELGDSPSRGALSDHVGAGRDVLVEGDAVLDIRLLGGERPPRG